jgi:hypothetical protein
MDDAHVVTLVWSIMQRLHDSHRLGPNIAQTAIQTLREGASYVQFEHKLQSLHIACVDIGCLNHSRRLIRGFVDNMIVVMDRRINDHLRVIDPVTSWKRVFRYSLSWQTR